MKKGYEMRQGYTVGVMALMEAMAGAHALDTGRTTCIAGGGGVSARWSVYDTRTIAPALSTFGHVLPVVECASYRN